MFFSCRTQLLRAPFSTKSKSASLSLQDMEITKKKKHTDTHKTKQKQQKFLFENALIYIEKKMPIRLFKTYFKEYRSRERYSSRIRTGDMRVFFSEK